MKRFLVILLMILSTIQIGINIQVNQTAEAESQTTYFARINSTESYLYSTPSTETDSIIFKLPATYYVELTGNADDSENAFYTANYNGINGYVQKSDVTPVQGYPINPFASNLSFRVFVPSGTDLRSTPSATTPFNILTSLPYMTTNLIYYGTKAGEEVISQRGNEWYFCKYIGQTTEYLGYVYAGFCDLLPPITENQETLPQVNSEIFIPTNASQSTSQAAPKLSKEIQAVLIICVTIPCILIIYLLFKPTKLTLGDRKTKKPAKKADYYEL